ncbi:MAG: hypothetical protein LBE75_06385 [Burkholderiales bacterium]|nr:hypothetical protein [Burkholderiales bacterium]
MRSKTRKSAAGIALAAMVLVLSACGGSTLSGASGDPPGDNKPLRGLAAPLFSKGGSSAQGKITIYQKDDRWQLSVTIFSLSPGASYRLAFFDNGNCSSPNAFSAGKLWSPPDMPEGIRPDKWIPLLHADTLGNLDAVTRLPNPGRHNEEVFRKRSVLVFVGDTVRELAPGVSNEVAACGVFDTIQTLL